MMMTIHCTPRRTAALAAAATLLIGRGEALDNGLAKTPQMGYNSWYDLMGTLTEDNIRETADAMVSLGLVELGYNYLNLDDCWAGPRDNATGRLTADKNWRGGTLKSVADYVHSKGMKFGTYTDRGTETCAGRPGALGHEALDAQTYADWGVDYLKEDSCHASSDHKTAYSDYGKMRDGLNATGRPILFSLCGWNAWYSPPDPSNGYGGGKTLGNSWRIGPDDTNWHGVLTNIDINADLAPYAGPGGWNDPCLLLGETYKGPAEQRITPTQSRAQFSMWAVMASPLLISANIRNMSAMNLETYRNKEVIAVNQDQLGEQGIRVLGSNLVQHSGGHGNIPARTATCASSRKTQQWQFGTGQYQNFLISASEKGLLLNADDCHSDLIFLPTHGQYTTNSTTTCCGSVGPNNLKFKKDWPSPGMLGMLPCGSLVNQCVTLENTHSLVLAKCDTSNKSQKWTFDAATETIRSVASPDQCVDAYNGPPVPSPGAVPDGTNVWARNLTGGAKAVVFINVGAADMRIPCNEACFASMGFASSTQHVTVRDLWTHTDNGTIAIVDGLSVDVQPSAVVMVKLTPA